MYVGGYSTVQSCILIVFGVFVLEVKVVQPCVITKI